MKELDLTDHGYVIPYESTPDQYRRAKAIAERDGQSLSFAPAKPTSWQPPEHSFCVRHDASVAEYREGKRRAAELGLEFVSAPDGWLGPAIRAKAAGDSTEVWTPPSNAICVPHNVTTEDWSRARETAERLGVECVVMPESVAMPKVLPKELRPGLPIVLTKAQARDPQLYRQKKAEAEKFGVSFSVE
jgi:hypothetical protein